MKFLLRCLLVLAVAVVLGVLLYYAVQALPGASTISPPGTSLDPKNGDTSTQPIGPQPQGGKNDSRDGFRLRSIIGIAGHVALFSAIVFASVLAKNFIFERKPNKKNLPD